MLYSHIFLYHFVLNIREWFVKEILV